MAQEKTWTLEECINYALDKNIQVRSWIIFGKVFIPVSDQYKDKLQEFLDKNFL